MSVRGRSISALFFPCLQRIKATRSRGLLLGFARQLCGERSVGGPVVGVASVVGIPFHLSFIGLGTAFVVSFRPVFPSPNVFMIRLLTAGNATCFRLYLAKQPFILFGWLKLVCLFRVTMSIAKRFVVPVAYNAPRTPAHRGLQFGSALKRPGWRRGRCCRHTLSLHSFSFHSFGYGFRRLP